MVKVVNIYGSSGSAGIIKGFVPIGLISEQTLPMGICMSCPDSSISHHSLVAQLMSPKACVPNL